jgi:hypothetical protein
MSTPLTQGTLYEAMAALEMPRTTQNKIRRMGMKPRKFQDRTAANTANLPGRQTPVFLATLALARIRRIDKEGIAVRLDNILDEMLPGIDIDELPKPIPVRVPTPYGTVYNTQTRTKTSVKDTIVIDVTDPVERPATPPGTHPQRRTGIGGAPRKGYSTETETYPPIQIKIMPIRRPEFTLANIPNTSLSVRIENGALIWERITRWPGKKHQLTRPLVNPVKKDKKSANMISYLGMMYITTYVWAGVSEMLDLMYAFLSNTRVRYAGLWWNVASVPQRQRHFLLQHASRNPDLVVTDWQGVGRTILVQQATDRIIAKSKRAERVALAESFFDNSFGNYSTWVTRINKARGF